MSSPADPLVYLNAEFKPLSQARISVMDRGFLLGDAVYEVIPVFAGIPFRLAHHLERLDRSLAAVQIENPLSGEQWTAVIDRLLEQYPQQDQSVYLQVTRGIAPARDHVFPQQATPTVFIMTRPVDPSTLPDPGQGITAITVDDIRWDCCNIKATTLLANVLARQQAAERNAAEAIFIRDGHAIEGAASNLFIVRDGLLITPPKSNKLLPGITRDLVLELCDANTIAYAETDISLEALIQADEIWLTSSVREIVPVIELDGRPVGDAKPGPLWLEIRALYDQYKNRLREQCLNRN